MHSMVGKLLVVTALVLGSLGASGVAVAAPPTMNLSSWEPTVDDGVVVGGTQTITVTNVGAVAIADVTFPLDEIPCDCVVAATSPSDGTVDAETWTIGEIAPGATATLTISYETSAGAAVAPDTRTDAAVPIDGGLSAVGVLVALVGGVALVARSRRNPGAATV